MGEQRDVVDVGGGGDREIERAPAGLAAACADGGGESSPFARDRGIDRQRLEGRLDHAEAQGAAGALVGVGGDEDAEVQLGQAGGADRALERRRDRRRRSAPRCRAAPASTRTGRRARRGSARGRRRASGARACAQTLASSGPLTHCRRRAGPSCATGRPATVIVNSSPASARRSTSATLLRSSFCGITGTQHDGSRTATWRVWARRRSSSAPVNDARRRVLIFDRPVLLGRSWC